MPPTAVADFSCRRWLAPAAMLLVLSCGGEAPETPDAAAQQSWAAAAEEGTPVVAVMPPALSPDEAMARSGALLRTGRHEQAIRLLEESRAAHPQDARLAFFLGRSLHLDTKLAGAEEAYRDAVRLQPELAEGWLRLSEIFIEQGRLQEALDALRALGRQVRRGPQLDYQEGFVLSKMGQFDAARARLRASLEARPENADAWYVLGLTFQRQGANGQAAEAFQRTLSLNPEYADAWYNLGNALARLGRTREAEEALRRFALVNEVTERRAATESNLRVLQRGAEMDLEAGRLMESGRQLDEAESIDAGLPWVQRLRGEVSLATGRQAEARQYLARAAALNPGSPEEHLALAEAFQKAGDAVAAARHRTAAEAMLTGMRGAP